MSIEKDIFKKSKVNFDNAVKYGFREEDERYIFSRNIMEDALRIDVVIDHEGMVKGNVIDLATGDEYTNFRIKYNAGVFAGTVREAFKTLLEDIQSKCFDSRYFMYEQSNRISKLIKEKYGTDPVFEWDKSPDFGVYKNEKSKKWYALIMKIDKSKLGADSDSGEVEIMNLKLAGEEVKMLIQAEGFYPAYHMNKKNWITVVLDGTVTDAYLMSLIEESYGYADTGKSVGNEWVIPANPKYYDVDQAFRESRIITWSQRASMKVGDFVYIYMTSPISSIMYKCKVIEAEIMRKGGPKKAPKAMKIELVDQYEEGRFSRDLMKQYGVGAVRGARHMTAELSKVIEEKQR